MTRLEFQELLQKESYKFLDEMIKNQVEQPQVMLFLELARAVGSILHETISDIEHKEALEFFNVEVLSTIDNIKGVSNDFPVEVIKERVLQ